MGKRRTIVGIGLASALLGALLGVSAQTGPAPKPAEKLTVDQIIARHIEAIGGEAAIKKIHSRVTKGTIEFVGQGIKGTAQEFAKDTNKRLSVLSVTGIGEISEGFDGKTAWSKNPFNGLVEKTGIELSDAQLDGVFNAELKWKELYPTIELIGMEQVGENNTYRLKFTPKSGSAVTRFFDAKTFLVLREDTARVTEQGTTPASASFSDFRAVDGVKMPFSTKITAGPVTVEGTLAEVTHNVPIDDAKFVKPTS